MSLSLSESAVLMTPLSILPFPSPLADIVAPGGRIKGCYEDIIDGVQVHFPKPCSLAGYVHAWLFLFRSPFFYRGVFLLLQSFVRGCMQVNDQLREMLVNENSENCALYSESEKKELIYQLFKLFAIGGELCQPEVDLEPYLNITKLAYKDLVTVYR